MGLASHPAAATDEVVLPADAVVVGRVLGAWGVKGGLKVKPLSSDPQALFSSRRWFLEPPAERLAVTLSVPRLLRLLRITQAREQGQTIVATCQELADRDAAQALAGSQVLVSRHSFPTPSEDEFYWIDLIGLSVHDRSQRKLGTVVGLIETGPHSVLRIAPDLAGGDEKPAEELLIPFVSAYVDRVDLAAREIAVDWDPDF